MARLVTTVEGGNFTLSLADGGSLPVQTEPDSGGGGGANVTTPWVTLLTDAPVTLATLDPFDTFEEGTIVAYVEFLQIGATAVGGSITRVAILQNVAGVLTNTLDQSTSVLDFDASHPTPPANLSTAIVGAAAAITSAGASPVVTATRPTGVAVYARATIGISKLDRPTTPVALSISPSAGTDGGGTPFTIVGSGLAGVSSITLDGVPAVISTMSDQLVTGVSRPAGGPGTGDVVITTPGGTFTLVNAWTYTVGIIPTITSIVPNTAPAESGSSHVIRGTGFTGALHVHLNGVDQGAPGTGFIVNSDTQITVPAITAGVAGVGDVVVVSSTTDPSTDGTNLFTRLPAGLFSWFRADIQLTAPGGILATWLDQGPWGAGIQIGFPNNLAFHASDVAGQPAVQIENVPSLIGNLAINNGAHITASAITVIMVAKRPTLNPDGEYILCLCNDALTTDAKTQPGAFVVTDTTAGGGSMTLTRNSVTATSGAGVVPNFVDPFCLSVRSDGVANTIARLSGTDIATVAETGAYDAGTLLLGCASAQPGPFAAPQVGEMHVAEVLIWIRELSAGELSGIMSTYIHGRYPTIPAC